MRAIILAAGEGTRLRPYTSDRPKCTVELGGKPLIQHQIEALRRAGAEEITVVTGYCAEQLASWGDIRRHNEQFASTNMVWSLMAAADRLDGSDDVIISYGDIVYETRIVAELVGCAEPLCTTIDLDWLSLWRVRSDNPLDDAETLRLSEAGDILEIGQTPESLDVVEGQYMGLILARAAVAPRLVEAYSGFGSEQTFGGRTRERMYMTDFLQALIDAGTPVRAVPVTRGWLEIDTRQELDVFNTMLDDDRLHEFVRLGE